MLGHRRGQRAVRHSRAFWAVRDGPDPVPSCCVFRSFSAAGASPWSPDAAVPWKGDVMCRNIKTLHNFSPPASDDEVRASALQFVRKLSGYHKPSRANEAAFDRAVDQVTCAARELLESLVTTAPPRDRETEAEKARLRSAARFGERRGNVAD